MRLALKSIAVAAAALWPRALPAEPYAPNLIRNGGMEEGQRLPVVWEQGAKVPGVTCSWANEGFQGNRSLKIEKSVNRYFPIAEWSQRVETQVPAGATHLEVRAWVRARQMTKAILDAQFSGRSGPSHEWVSYIGAKTPRDRPASHGWKLYEGSVPLPQGTSSIGISLQVYGPGTVWFDEVSAYCRGPNLPPPPPSQAGKVSPDDSEKKTEEGANLVANWSFEESDDEDPASWQKGAAVDGVEYLWLKGDAQHGNRSVGFQKTAKRFFPIAEWVQQLPKPPAGARHAEFVASVKAKNVAKSVIDFQFETISGNSSHAWAQYIGAQEPGDAPVTHDWKAYRGTVELPPDVSGVRIALQMYGSGVIAFDSIGVRYVEEEKQP